MIGDFPPGQEFQSISSTGKSENFLDSVPLEKRIIPRGIYKAIILDCLTVIVALGLSYTYFLYSQSGGGLVPVVVLLTLFLILNTLEIILIKNIWRRLLVLGLEILALFAFFYTLPPNLLLVAFGFLILFFLWGEANGRREIKRVLKPNYFKIARVSSAKIITALIFLALIIYFPKFDTQENPISEAAFDKIFGWTLTGVSRFYPEIKFQGTINEMIKSIADFEIRRNPNFNELSVVAQEEIKQQIATDTTRKLEEWAKFELNDNDRVKTALYNFVSTNIDKVRVERGEEFKIIWFAVLFLFIRSFGIIYLVLSSILNFFAVQLLLAANIIYVSGQTQTKETVVL